MRIDKAEEKGANRGTKAYHRIQSQQSRNMPLHVMITCSGGLYDTATLYTFIRSIFRSAL